MRTFAGWLVFAVGVVAAVRPAAQPAPAGAGELKTVRVQGSVYMIVGAGANIAVQIGDNGVFVVDTGAAAYTDRVLAAIRELSKKDIRWIVNTTLDPDHVGGNEKISKAGRTVQREPRGHHRPREAAAQNGQAARAGADQRAAAQHVLQRLERLLLQRRSRVHLPLALAHRRRRHRAISATRTSSWRATRIRRPPIR